MNAQHIGMRAAACAVVLSINQPISESYAQPAASTKTASIVTKRHKVAIQVTQNDREIMRPALNNARNVAEYYKRKHEIAYIEIVTYGPGLHMLRADTSPVKDLIGPMTLEHTNLTFVACANTKAAQSKAEGKPIELLAEARITPSGVVRLMELQKQGYAYIRP